MRLCLTTVTFLILICLAVTLPRAEETPSEFGPPIENNPALLHKWLWENKLRPSLIDKQEAARQLMTGEVTNWTEYDIYFYSIDLTVDHVFQQIYGRVGIYGTTTVGSLDSIKVNLSDSLTVDSVYNSTGNLVYNHGADHLTVHLDRLYSLGEAFDFTVVYHGHPETVGGFVGFDFGIRYTVPHITTLSEPMGARSWWPCNDITTDKADSVDIIVTVDTSLVVSSNGLLESDIDNGDGTHTVYWKERYPIVSYLVSLGIHNYSVWEDWYVYSPTDSMPLVYYVYSDHDAYSRPYFGVIPEMIGILKGYFGEYPFINEKYGCTHFDWGGAMEHQTNTSTVANSFGYSADIICHELGHQWWGDMITCADWHHIWINEGFAVYSEALYHEAKNGVSDYHQYMNGFEYTGSGSIYIDDTTDVWNIFGWIVYDKGGWVLHMLRHVVGDDDFFQSLSDYRDQFIWTTASTEDFQGVVEAVSGMDLDYFFQEWIYGTFRPSYRHSYLTESNPSGGWDTYLHVRQIQISDPLAYTMPIDIRLNLPSGNEIRTIFNDQRAQDFILHSDEKPTGLALDPDRWISRIEYSEAYRIHIVNDNLSDGGQFEVYADTVEIKSGSGGFTCSLIAGALPSGWQLDGSTGEISGIASQSGDFTFTIEAVDPANSSYVDTLQYTIQVAGNPDRPGDANFDGPVNVGDAVFLINYVFKNGSAPTMPNWADTNSDCAVNVGDAVYLINFVFKNGADPIMGCVE